MKTAHRYLRQDLCKLVLSRVEIDKGPGSRLIAVHVYCRRYAPNRGKSMGTLRQILSRTFTEANPLEGVSPDAADQNGDGEVKLTDTAAEAKAYRAA